MNGLPLEGAFAAHLKATARTQKDSTGEAPAWRTYFGRGPLWDLFADHFDLTHQIAAGKKKVTAYPRHPATPTRVMSWDEIRRVGNSMFGG